MTKKAAVNIMLKYLFHNAANMKVHWYVEIDKNNRG